MSAPQPSQPAQPGKKLQRAGGTEYEGFVDGALREHVVGAGAPPSIADIEPRELLRYAAGKASDDERTAFEDFVKRSKWAYDRVVSLVRSNRPDQNAGLRGQIGRRLLAGGKIKTVGVVAQAVLEVEGVKTKSLEDAWKTLEKNGSLKTRAACLMGLGRHEDARKLLEAPGDDAVLNLLRRVSRAALEGGALEGGTLDERSDDAALFALLDAFPSL